MAGRDPWAKMYIGMVSETATGSRSKKAKQPVEYCTRLLRVKEEEEEGGSSTLQWGLFPHFVVCVCLLLSITYWPY